MIFYHKILQHLPLVTTIEGQGQEKLWSWNKINIYEKSEQKLQQTLESAYGQREGKISITNAELQCSDFKNLG